VVLLRRSIVIVVLALILLALSGCAKKYTFDFVKERDAKNAQGAWNEEYEIEYLPQGAYLNDDALTSPFRFKGDFAVDIQFYVNVGAEHYLNWLDIYLIDTDGWDYDLNIGLGMYFQSPSSGKSWTGTSTIGFTETPGALPGIVLDGVNDLRIAKTGNKIDIRMNDVTYPQFTIAPADELDSYNIFISAYDDGNDEHKGFYLQKVVVTYESGNSIPV